MELTSLKVSSESLDMKEIILTDRDYLIYLQNKEIIQKLNQLLRLNEK